VNTRKSVLLIIPSFLMISPVIWCQASAQPVDSEPEPAATVELGGGPRSAKTKPLSDKGHVCIARV
jgi:hypothetical protein